MKADYDIVTTVELEGGLVKMCNLSEYIEEKGIDLTTSTINNQRKRWILIDGELYDKNKTWLIPKNEK